MVYNGLGLEEGVLRHVEAAQESGVATFAVGDAVDPIQYTSGETAGKPDPHFWTDPDRMAKAVELIADHVVEERGRRRRDHGPGERRSLPRRDRSSSSTWMETSGSPRSRPDGATW